MKILFVTAPTNSPVQTWYPPLGLGYLSSYLKKYLEAPEKVEIKLCDFAQGESYAKALKQFKPDFIGLTSTTTGFSRTISLANSLKLLSDVPIILGGTHISALPQSLPKSVDIGVIGEGEQTFLELVQLYLVERHFNHKALKNIDGLCYRNYNMVETTKTFS